MCVEMLYHNIIIMRVRIVLKLILKVTHQIKIYNMQ